MSSDQRSFLQTGELLQQKNPLVHCITSPIAVNDCANAVLALGARPIMAEHPEEAAGITAISASLGVSLANITDARIHSIFLSGAMALEQKKPSVIDVVGVNCSPMRMNLAKRFVSECRPAVIKGNASEIRALAGASFGEAGIDTADSDRLSPDNPGAVEAMAQILSSFSARTGAVVLASGIVDMISDGRDVWTIENGCPSMARVTGTGCILNCIIASCLAVAESPADAALYGTMLLGVSGETAEQLLRDRGLSGLGSYHIALIDALSLADREVLEQKGKVRRL